MEQSAPSRRAIILRILLPFALGYYLSYLFRVVNAVLAPDLIAELGLSADILGLLTASYFITFAAVQLPLGLLLDRYNPGKIEALLLLFAALGALRFATGESTLDLIIGRGLIGFGVSACLMAAFKSFTLWFKPHQLPMINGIIMASGGLGALTATLPVQAALSVTDWRGVFLGLALLALVSAALVFFLVPDHHGSRQSETLQEQLAGIRQVFTNAYFWRIAPISMLTQASFISVQSLWAGPWLQDVGHLSRTDAAGVLLLLAAAMVCGFLVMGTLATRLSYAGIPPVRVAGIGQFIFILVQIAIILEPPAGYLTLAWIAFGFFGTTGIIQYAVLSQSFARHLSGRVNTAINLFVFIAAFALQWLSGAIIDLWPPSATGNYLPESYHAAFSLLLLIQLLAFAWFVGPQIGSWVKRVTG